MMESEGNTTITVDVPIPRDLYDRAERHAERTGKDVEECLLNATLFEYEWHVVD